MHTQPTESICKSDPKHEREVESSLIYDLHPGDMSLPCRSILSAPESNGFIVRLHKPKVKKTYETTHRSSGESGRRNTTNSCPLSIVSILLINFQTILPTMIKISVRASSTKSIFSWLNLQVNISDC